MKTGRFPLTVTEGGVSAKIREIQQTKNGSTYTGYLIDYILLGKRKQEFRSDLAEAKQVALDACRKIARGQQLTLQLNNSDGLVYVRATEALAKIGKPLDTACREYADAMTILGGLASLTEAVQFFVKQHAGVIQKTVPDAVKELIEQIETEQQNTNSGKRRKVAWLKLIKAHVKGKLARDFQCSISDLTSALLEPWLIGLKCSERTRRNVRDCVASFLKWAKGRNYLSKDADPLANVQQFRKRKRGAVKIITPEVLITVLAHAPDDLIPYLALRAFAGLRESEARALDWHYIDFATGWIEITDEVAKQTDDEEGVARMVKIRPILAEWLHNHAKKSGPVCPYANAIKQASKIAVKAGVKIPRNALRHTFISVEVALTNDLNAVAVEAGNSPSVIKDHYWNKKLLPEQASKWFTVTPAKVAEEKAKFAKVITLPEGEQKIAA